MSPAERSKIAYDVESLKKALRNECSIRNRTTDKAMLAYCDEMVRLLRCDIASLEKRLKRRGKPKPKVIQ